MDDKPSSAQQNQHGSKERISLLAHIKAIDANPPKSAASNKLKKPHAPMDRFQRVTIGFTVAGTILALLTLVVFYRQFKEMATQTGILNQRLSRLPLMPSNRPRELKGNLL